MVLAALTGSKMSFYTTFFATGQLAAQVRRQFAENVRILFDHDALTTFFGESRRQRPRYS